LEKDFDGLKTEMEEQNDDLKEFECQKVFTENFNE
jgi:hypothetical protein